MPAREALAGWLDGALPAWVGCLGRSPQQLRLRPLRASWGRCSSRGVVTLSLDLAQLPESLAEYVLVHELAHLTHLDHSPRFWALVDRHLPDRKGRVEALKAWQARILPLWRASAKNGAVQK